MKIADLLSEVSIDLNAVASTKEEAIEAAVKLMVASGRINDPETYKKGVFAREEEGTTGIGGGIAIPHCKSESVSKPGLAAMVFKDGTEFEALDGEKVKLLFLIAAPNTDDNVHLQVLSHLSKMLMYQEFTDALLEATSKQEFMKVLTDAEQEEKGGQGNMDVAKKKFILGVTGCPTGIAHTYMAAEKLEQTAKAMGCEIKVETRGTGGVKNELTSEEISRADAIIIASDTKVPMDRFDGKRVVEAQVSDGINKADKLLDMALSGEAAIYHSGRETQKHTDNVVGKESAGHQIYKHLMNGVSHMLPFVVGGGILIALAFLIDGLSVDLSSLSVADRGNFGSITSSAAMFKNIGGLAFGFMLPVLAGFIAMSIADRPGLALGFVGGVIAANGKSGFLGAMLAGFIAGYVIVLLKKVFAKLPESLDGIKSILLYPLFGIFLVGIIMNYVVEPPIGALNTALNSGLSGMTGTSAILLGIIVGGMMAVDMGGPVNKAAYVFGVASISAGNFNIMAAVMVGGMVPPLAIAIATFIFKNKFTEEERKAGPVNIVMGLSFITEGAIPFAAADPLRVIPACIIGAASAGALSMAFNCTLMAPHGGIFVFPVVGNALMYLLALAVGSVIGAICLGLFKKKIVE